MPTTKSRFVNVTGSTSTLKGSAVIAPPFVQAVGQNEADVLAQVSGNTIMDKVVTDLSIAGYAKNAGVSMTLTSTTAITLNLAAIAAATGVVIAGDTAFALVNQLTFVNTGAVDLTLSPGASNGLAMGFGGTSPTLVIPAGGSVTLKSVTGYTVDATHKNITVTPTSGGTLLITVGGS